MAKTKTINKTNNKYMTKDIWYLNKRQIRRTKNILTWDDDTVCPAHKISTVVMEPYVPMSFAQKLIDSLVEIEETGNAEIVTTKLKDLMT